MQMSQVSIRLLPDDYALVKRWAQQQGLSLAAAFKTITKEAFDEWKLEYLVTEYKHGRMGLKKAWKRSTLSLMAFLKLLDENDVDPPHTEIMELKSTEKRQLLTPQLLFKDKKTPQRQTNELELTEIGQNG